MQIIKQSDITTSKWSGGITSELFIYPPESNYKELNFDFRLSRATIEVEESEFTNLPNVNRTLLLLEGELELIHLNQYSKLLKPYQFDTFSGSWKTKSIRKSENQVPIDFNLMTTGNTRGRLSVIKSKNKKQYHSYKINNHFIIFYVVKGTLNFNDTNISEGELLVFDQPQKEEFRFNLLADSNVIVVRIDL